MKMLLRVSIFLLFFSSSDAFCNKLFFGLGFYSINAEVDGQDSEISNLGAYKFQYDFNLTKELDLFVGYNLIVEDIFTGDKSFGPSFGIAYYPKGNDTLVSSQIGNISFSKLKNFNYYFLGAFSQRQYQSIKTSYAGFTLGAGVEVGVDDKYIIYTDVQNSFLNGANDGVANELISTFGVRFYYGD